MKRTDADAASQRSYSCAETRNAISNLQAAESLHEISVKTPNLRDYFAAKAMQAMISNHLIIDNDSDGAVNYASSAAYKFADAMLKARE
ncbi:hypothetical protein ACQRVR_005203 [Enterobacter cloacae]